MNVLVFTPYLYDTVPGQRFRIEQWARHLARQGIHCAFLPFETAALKDVLYETLDWLATRQERVERALAARHLKEGMLVLYDLTSVAYTGHTCPLARRGHSKEGNSQDPQIEFGLVCDAEGRPVAVEVFAGNTADPKTLGAQVEKVQKRFGLKRVVVVGDRGMITDARVREDLKPAGLEWITALRAPAIRGLVQREALQLSLFDQQDLAEITSEEYPGERLIACRNPLLAQERARKREELLQVTQQGLDAIVAATQREKRPLKGERAIALRVGRVLDRHKVGKHFTWQMTPEGVLSYQRKQDQIAQEAALDGIYIVRTNVPKQRMAGPAVVAAYKRLAEVERAFRSLKTVDLKVRPIYHWLERRVRAHVFLCMLAYYVEWHMRQALAPLLFDDAHPEAGEALRASVVQPAQRSPEAQAKASTKRTANGEPVHSFQTLLRDLATVTKNRIRLPATDPAPEQEFDKLAIPTPLQRRALELLNVPLTA